jgi:hypothetical protein
VQQSWGRSILVWVDGQQRELLIYADRKPIKASDKACTTPEV